MPVVQLAFTPSKEKIEWAKGLIEAFNEHQKSGKVLEQQIFYDYIMNFVFSFPRVHLHIMVK